MFCNVASGSNRIFFKINDREVECGAKFDDDNLLLFDSPVITTKLRTSVEFRYKRAKD